jgi:hypothetical protein
LEVFGKRQSLSRDLVGVVGSRHGFRIWLRVSEVRGSLSVAALGVATLLDNGAQLDTRRNVVDVTLDVLGNVIARV